ncbi:uncharacterized protein BDV17DRAFT_260921 [Aspergillus undulatus]|uniref:uncharacterized protein n=1 Tax=Aspergillus undulatus TaxID=1810928 RepID=UPI003CCD17AF
MAFDCYCAICGVGFSGMKIGTPSDATAERRQQYVQSISRSLDGARYRVTSDDESIQSYDPRLVDQENIAWTSRVHCLGIHDVEGKSKAFVSGPGYYSDAGEMAVKMGQRAQRTYFSCYGFGTDEVPGPVVPFHWCCFEILLRSLTGTTDPKNVDLDVLYDAMMSLCNQTGSALRLLYGDDVAQAQGQYWRCLPGVEYTVRHPTNTPDLTDFLKTQIKSNATLRTPSKALELDLSNREARNPFSILPPELIYQICSFLPGDSLKSLIQASPFIYLLTRDDHFWRRFIETDMPWLWEAEALTKSKSKTGPDSRSDSDSDFDSDSSLDLDHKQVYIWLDAITKPKYGLEDTNLMGAANRRRIWGACEELKRGYEAKCR